jgi:hypothetical protein
MNKIEANTYDFKFKIENFDEVLHTLTSRIFNHKKNQQANQILLKMATLRVGKNNLFLLILSHIFFIYSEISRYLVILIFEKFFAKNNAKFMVVIFFDIYKFGYYKLKI